jgi:hypothetical protein
MKKVLILAIGLFTLALCKSQTTDNDVLPGGDTSMLISPEYFTSNGFNRVNSNKHLNYYVNNTRGVPIQQLWDIRFVFKSSVEAKVYLDKNLIAMSEGGVEYKKKIVLPNTNDLHVFSSSSEMFEMSKNLGLKTLTWVIVFRIDRVVGKIFVFGYHPTPGDCYTIALEATKKTSLKLGLNIDSKEYSLPNPVVDAKLQSKIVKSKAGFIIPYGFENSILDNDLTQYFDQEFKYPGEDLVMRTFVVQPDSLLKDSIYSIFCKNKSGAAMSVYLNIFMPNLEKIGDINLKETKDSIKCKELFNGDFKIDAFYSIGKNSELGKGYKYAFVAAYFKRGCGDVYTVYLFNDFEKFTLFGNTYDDVVRYN